MDWTAHRDGGIAAEPAKRNVQVSGSVNALVLCSVIAVAACNIALPFGGDQSLFALGARHILAGDVLYRDFWDIKQPGIFWFFAIARLTVGAGPGAVHLLEAAWSIVLGVLMYLAAMRWFAGRHMRLIVPLLGAGYMQLVLTRDSATQVESLVALPLFTTLWLSVEAVRGTPHRPLLLFGAGVAAAIAVCFKLLFVAVLAAMWLALLLAAVRGDGVFEIRRRPIHAIGGLVIGFAAPLAITVLWFAAHGAASAALMTWFVAPSDIVRDVPHQQVAVLIGSARGFAASFLPMIVLAVFGCAAVRRGDLLASGALGWLAGGVFTIVLQVTSWWSYQWFLLAAPTGLLAAFGLQELSRLGLVRNRYAVILIAASLIGYPAVRAHVKLIGLARHGFGLQAAQRIAFQEEIAPALRRARVTAGELHPIVARDVYVFGNPALYETLGTLQPVAINGWLPELLTQRTRHELMTEMCNFPPRVIYAEDANASDFAVLVKRSPELSAFLAERYRHRKARFGQIYSRRDPARSGHACDAVANARQPRRGS